MKKRKTFQKVTAKDFAEENQATEDTIHTYIAEYLTKNLIGFFQTVENSNRHKGWYAAVQQKKLKQRGARTGFPDIIIWYFDRDEIPKTLCLEVKVPGQDAKPYQKELHKELAKHGCDTYVVHNVDETRQVLNSLGVPTRES